MRYYRLSTSWRVLAKRLSPQRNNDGAGGAAMRGDWDWDIIPEGRVEWIGFSIALVVVLVAAWWISR